MKTYLLYKGFYEPRTSAGKPAFHDDTNILVLSRKAGYVRCDIRFDRSDAECFDAKTTDMAAARRHAATNLEPYAMQQIDLSGSPTSTPAQEAWKVWFEPWTEEDTDKAVLRPESEGAPFEHETAKRIPC